MVLEPYHATLRMSDESEKKISSLNDYNSKNLIQALWTICENKQLIRSIFHFNSKINDYGLYKVLMT